MNRYFNLFIYAVILPGLFACQNDKNPASGYETKYQQNGVPFENVPELQDIIMYEVNLRAFSATGDIQGVIDNLDHIESLGVNVIWLMPVHPVGEINSVNSPYSVKDYKSVGTEFGTLSDLRNLTDQAHARGMAVIMDWIANHTAWDNEWINNKSWYTQDINGNIIHPPGTNWLDVADLNYNNQEMRNAMTDALHFWIYEANIDGYRCDHADGVPFDFWQNAIQTLNKIPDRELIFFAEGTRSDHFNAGFGLNFGWQTYSALKEVFNGLEAGYYFNEQISEYNNTPEGKHWVRFTTNHDESAWDATPVSLFNGIDGALAASVVSVFSGGVPLIYSSQEVGTANNVPFFSNSIINWNNNPQMLESYQKMFQFYSTSQAAKEGLNTVYPHNSIAGFKKSFSDEEIVIITNLRNTTINYNIPNDLENTEWTDIMTQNNISLSGQITLEPYAFYILEQ
jgi:glycosidase